MDIKRWKVMLAVDDYGSFTKAGEALGYTQSGVTQMMKALEKEVGFSLFIKGKKGAVLTPEAQSLIPSVRALLNADEVVLQEISALKGTPTGTITIGTYLSCSIHWIPGIIQKFRNSHPNILFRIIEGAEDDLPDWIQERRVDIGFLNHQQKHHYQFLPVMEDEMFAVLPHGHPLACQDSIPIEELNGAPFVTTEYTPGSDIYRVLNKFHIKPDIRFLSINEFSVLSMVEHGLGITILPGLLLRGQTGNFVIRQLNPRSFRRLGLGYSSYDDLSPASRIFLEYAKSFLMDD